MIRVALVDDQAIVRAGLARILSPTDGFELMAECADGREAVDALLGSAVDLVVLDVEMPRLDGYGVLREMRRKGLFRHTRVLMLTSLSKEKDWYKAYRHGAHQYLTKPFKPEELAETVVWLLELTGEQASNHREKELERAELLARVEAVFAPPQGAAHGI
jgi:DNA-binding NarL/FixJ family response regulator